MGISFRQFITKSNSKSNKNQTSGPNVCSGRGKSYCLIHRRYFETSWCPDCSRSSRKFIILHIYLGCCLY
ncbi:hypothetical protein EDC94DRAFT_601555 [Helicostylum pulchrum]|nr:hypothetical protein EDC94DRAFT_601555 [Helicostylum pulchrum]